jgi:RNA polymerase sigma-70 factor, ECF subfamily
VIQAPARTAVAADADLVLAVRAGDSDAFEDLYARHWPRVVGVCARRVPASDAEDVAQDAFLRALHRLDTLDDPARFGPWVRTIAVRACADAVRRRSAVTFGDVPDMVDTTHPTHDDVVVAREDARQLASGLATLQPRDSHALWLRDALDIPVGDIARDLGMTEASTRVMLARARQRLRAAMGAVAAWIAALVGLRRQWLSSLLPTNPGTRHRGRPRCSRHRRGRPGRPTDARHPPRSRSRNTRPP